MWNYDFRRKNIKISILPDEHQEEYYYIITIDPQEKTIVSQEGMNKTIQKWG